MSRPAHAPVDSRSQNSRPDFGRSLPLSRKNTQVKLPFANAMHGLDATNCRGSTSEVLQAQHDPQPGLHVAMILFDQIVQVFDERSLVKVGSRPCC